MTDASVQSAEKALEQMSINENQSTTSETPATESSTTETKSEQASSSSTSSTGSLYVGELDPSVTEAVLFEVFSAVGQVVSIRVCRDAVTHESLGYAYVNFQQAADAKRAMAELNFSNIRGRPCRIMWSQRDPAMRKNGRGNVYIKNLDPSIDNKALHDTFSTFGEILSSKVVTDLQGNSLGYGFVHFAESEHADAAIRVVNGMSLNNREVYVARHLPRNERESQAESQRAKFTNVYVKNIGLDVSEPELEKMFAVYGKITSAALGKDGEGKSRGFGFVNFEDHEAAQKAVDELNDKDINGQKLYVGRAQNKFERQTELKKQYEAARLEKLAKYQGINLYVKNLDDNISDKELQEVFAPFGTITSARVMTDDQGKSRGFGFVCYSSPEEATRAISELNQHLLGSKPLYVALAQRKDMRQNQMRQQLNARNQLRMQQQAAVSGLPGQLLGGPVMYGGPNQPLGFMGGPPGNRVPFPSDPQLMGIAGPRGPALGGQWQNQSGSAPFAGKPESLASVVAAVPEEAKKQVIGEAMYPKVLAHEQIKDADLAGKITGMLLDMDNDELIELVDRDELLKEQVEEALTAYNQYLKSQGS